MKLTIRDLENFDTILELRENPIMAGELLLNRRYAPIQKLMIWGMWTHPYSMLDCGRGTGKGNTAKTRIMTSSGALNLGDILPSKLIDLDKESYLEDTSGIKIHTPEGMRGVKGWFSHGHIPTLTFTTSRGFKTKFCTTNPTLTIRNGQLGWLSSDKLKVGDYLVLNRKNEDWEYQDNGLEPDIARMMGYLVGDGHINKETCFGLTTADEYILDDFINISDKHFNFGPYISNDSISKITYRANISSREIRKELYDLGLGYEKSLDKTIPKSIWNSSRIAQREFLRGLMDTDGTADKRSGFLSYCTISKQLAQEVQLLLLSFGIISKIREKIGRYKKDSGEIVECSMAYMVDISGTKDCTLFYDHIGFGLERKQSRRSALSEKINSNIDIIPDLTSLYRELVKKIPRSDYTTGRNAERTVLKSTTSGVYQTTYERLPRMIDLFKEVDHPGVEYLQDVDKWGFFYDPIVSIEEGFDYMYDLEIIPEQGDKLKNAFIADGFVTHNCVHAETTIEIKQPAGIGYTYTNLTMKELYDLSEHKLTYTDGEEWWGSLPPKTEIMSINKKGIFEWKEIAAVFKQKIKPDGMLKITTINNRVFMCTPQHQFLTRKKARKLGFVKANDLHAGSVLCIYDNGKIGYDEVISWNRVSAANAGEFVYDLNIPGNESYVANEIVVHNTTMAADIQVLSGLLYPGSQSMVVSHSMKGTKLVFDEMINTWTRSIYVKDSVADRPVKGSDECRMDFKSAGLSGKTTRIVGVATDAAKGGLGIRGRRVNRVLHIDEWIFLSRDLIDSVIMPCASNNEDPMAPPVYDKNMTRWLFTSSSGYTFMEGYDRMREFRDGFRDGDPDFFYCNANYLDMPKGFIKEESLKIWMATIKKKNPGKWATEIEAKWISESGTWYNSLEIMGNPEISLEKPGGMWVHHEDNKDVYYEDSNHEDMFVLGVDPAEQQDETAYTLIKILPDQLIVMESLAIKGQTMIEVAETIRKYMDRYSIMLIAEDPEQGGRAGIEPELKRQLSRLNVFTGKTELFRPVYPHKEWLKKNEDVPVGARMILKRVPFSANSSTANLTDMNISMRSLIRQGVLVAPLSIDKSMYRPEEIPAMMEKLELAKAEIHKMMRQVVSIEAEPIGEGKFGKESKSASSLGRFHFDSKDKKDRWASLLITCWEASIIQQEINVPQDSEEEACLALPSIYQSNHQGMMSEWYGSNMGYGML